VTTSVVSCDGKTVAGSGGHASLLPLLHGENGDTSETFVVPVSRWDPDWEAVAARGLH
jgi:hypothetical protein